MCRSCLTLVWLGLLRAGTRLVNDDLHRTRILKEHDDCSCLVDRIQEKHGRETPLQFVNMACGLDSRAFRLAWPANTTVFEIDRQEVGDFCFCFIRAGPVLIMTPYMSLQGCTRGLLTYGLPGSTSR